MAKSKKLSTEQAPVIPTATEPSAAAVSSPIEQLKQLQEQFEVQKRAIVEKVEVEFNSNLVALLNSYNALPEEMRNGIFALPVNVATLKTMGLQVIPSDAPKRGRKPRTAPVAAKAKGSDKRTKSKSGKSVAEMILGVLNTDETDITGIIARIKDSFGDEPKKSSISQTLNKLKKDKKIKNPSRGCYTIA